MKKLKITILVTALLLLAGQIASAGMRNRKIGNPEDNQPQAGEVFSSYFARITRGGSFPGIHLDAPEKIQSSFLNRIKKSTWVGDESQIVKQLENQGIDLWGSWYQEKIPQKLLFATPESLALFSAQLGKLILEDQGQCAPHCPTAESILKQPWELQSAFAHQEFTRAFVYRTPLFNGRLLLDFLGDQYHFSAGEVAANTRVSILNHADFVNAVRELGYGGIVYFRGITGPDPRQPLDLRKHLIILDDEMLLKGSPFEYSIFKCLEMAGILVHESSHVFQDLVGIKMGLDIRVTSPESAMIVEGVAETLAEKAMRKAGASLNYPSALSLFATEQGLEIVYRPGNESSGVLFPYTVGLPFVWSLYDLALTEERTTKLTENLLQILGGKLDLQQFLNLKEVPQVSH
jgi:hypothetical protein